MPINISIFYNNVGDLEVNIHGLKELLKQTDYLNNCIRINKYINK